MKQQIESTLNLIFSYTVHQWLSTGLELSEEDRRSFRQWKSRYKVGKLTQEKQLYILYVFGCVYFDSAALKLPSE